MKTEYRDESFKLVDRSHNDENNSNGVNISYAKPRY